MDDYKIGSSGGWNQVDQAAMSALGGQLGPDNPQSSASKVSELGVLAAISYLNSGQQHETNAITLAAQDTLDATYRLSNAGKLAEANFRKSRQLPLLARTDRRLLRSADPAITDQFAGTEGLTAKLCGPPQAITSQLAEMERRLKDETHGLHCIQLENDTEAEALLLALLAQAPLTPHKFKHLYLSLMAYYCHKTHEGVYTGRGLQQISAPTQQVLRQHLHQDLANGRVARAETLINLGVLPTQKDIAVLQQQHPVGSDTRSIILAVATEAALALHETADRETILQATQQDYADLEKWHKPLEKLRTALNTAGQVVTKLGCSIGFGAALITGVKAQPLLLGSLAFPIASLLLTPGAAMGLIDQRSRTDTIVSGLVLGACLLTAPWVVAGWAGAGTVMAIGKTAQAQLEQWARVDNKRKYRLHNNAKTLKKSMDITN